MNAYIEKFLWITRYHSWQYVTGNGTRDENSLTEFWVELLPTSAVVAQVSPLSSLCPVQSRRPAVVVFRGDKKAAEKAIGSRQQAFRFFSLFTYGIARCLSSLAKTVHHHPLHGFTRTFFRVALRGKRRMSLGGQKRLWQRVVESSLLSVAGR